MSAAKVIDASALVAVLFDEPGGDGVRVQLQGATLIAPDLLNIELASVCLMKIRRNPKRRDEFLAQYTLRTHINWQTIPIEADEVLALALETGLTAYNATYLWIARTQNADLITLDKKLAAAFAG